MEEFVIPLGYMNSWERSVVEVVADIVRRFPTGDGMTASLGHGLTRSVCHAVAILSLLPVSTSPQLPL
jgi:hypothetical protein